MAGAGAGPLLRAPLGPCRRDKPPADHCRGAAARPPPPPPAGDSGCAALWPLSAASAAPVVRRQKGRQTGRAGFLGRSAVCEVSRHAGAAESFYVGSDTPLYAVCQCKHGGEGTGGHYAQRLERNFLGKQCIPSIVHSTPDIGF